MTRQGPRKAVPPDHWRGRRDSARDHLERARDAITLAKPTQDARAIVSLIVLAAIAYADALTANRAQVVNQQDHASAPRLLREVLRNLLPDEQARGFRDILALKDEAHYGAKPLLMTRARGLFTKLERFAAWAEDQLPHQPK
jgi:hypothetical protein